MVHLGERWTMRGRTERQAKMLFGVTTEEFIPEKHPIRRVRKLIDEVLAALSPELTAMYAPAGRYSVPPEHLIKATLLMAVYSIRSERQFCERLQYDLSSSGSWASTSPTTLSTTPPSPRTASASWNMTLPRACWARSYAKRASGD